jgi:hypothetical protein
LAETPESRDVLDRSLWLVYKEFKILTGVRVFAAQFPKTIKDIISEKMEPGIVI